VLYLQLIIFLVEDDVLIDNDVFSVTDFMNLKIKSTQFFRGAYSNKIYVHIFIWMSAHTYKKNEREVMAGDRPASEYGQQASYTSLFPTLPLSPSLFHTPCRFLLTYHACTVTSTYVQQR
jgi:hypothetical protein